MTVERYFSIIVGFLVLLSLVMSQTHHLNWLWLTTFIGFNLFQSGFTKFCFLTIVLKKLGVPSESRKNIN